MNWKQRQVEGQKITHTAWKSIPRADNTPTVCMNSCCLENSKIRKAWEWNDLAPIVCDSDPKNSKKIKKRSTIVTSTTWKSVPRADNTPTVPIAAAWKKSEWKSLRINWGTTKSTATKEKCIISVIIVPLKWLTLR